MPLTRLAALADLSPHDGEREREFAACEAQAKLRRPCCLRGAGYAFILFAPRSPPTRGHASRGQPRLRGAKVFPHRTKRWGAERRKAQSFSVRACEARRMPFPLLREATKTRAPRGAPPAAFLGSGPRIAVFGSSRRPLWRQFASSACRASSFRRYLNRSRSEHLAGRSFCRPGRCPEPPGCEVTSLRAQAAAPRSAFKSVPRKTPHRERG